MAFKLSYASDEPNFEVTELVAGNSAETYAQGEALKLASGKVTKCGATDTPVYIAIGDKDSANNVPCYKIRDTQVFEVPCYAATTDLNVGDKVTLHTDGLQITATTTSGVATLVKTAAQGAMALVRF